MIKTLVNLQDPQERMNRRANLWMCRVCEPSLKLDIVCREGFMWKVFVSNRTEEISPSGMIEEGIGNRGMAWSH
jgi:hypothetical protein